MERMHYNIYMKYSLLSHIHGVLFSVLTMLKTDTLI